MGNVTSLRGGPIITPEPNQSCIEELERLLEAAKAGEIVGIALAALHGDQSSSYRLAGMAGGFGMLGAIEMVKAEVVAINFGFEE